MSERPCDVCKRPRWDGGHALNERECADANGEVCRLHSRIGTLAKALERIGKMARGRKNEGPNLATDIAVCADEALAAATRALTGEGAGT